MQKEFSFQKNNILLRAPEPEDIHLLYEWENDPDLWELSNTLTPVSMHTVEQFIQDSRLDIYQTKQFRWMIVLISDKKKETIGTIDLFDFEPYHKRVGIGILIRDVSLRRMGYASDALAITIDYCFRILQLHLVYCNISEKNTASQALFKKFGFKISGIKKDWLFNQRKWENELLLQLLNPEM
jgi:diamine N-acetyltransferase